MNLLKRTKRIFELSKKDFASLDALTDEQLSDMPDQDQKAEFFGEGTHEEFEKQKRSDEGLSNIFGIDHEE